MNTATNLNYPLAVPHSAPTRVQTSNTSGHSGTNISSNTNINSNNSIANAASNAASGASGSATSFATNTTTTTTTVSAMQTTNNNNINGSLSDSLASTDGQRTPNVEHLSKTNLYIRGLQTNTSDQDLYNMCARFGQISSTKAILEKSTGCCRGYGFVEFTTPQAAELAVQELTKSGIQAQMAKISPLYHHSSSSSHHNQPHHHHQHQQHHHHHHHNHHHHNNNNNGSTGHGSGSQHNHQNHPSNHTNHADPTNLYIANLPPNMSELELQSLLSTYGPVVSTRILRDQSNIPRGVGFARMESRDKCEQIIEQLNGRPCKGWKEPLLVKFADGGSKRRHHHNNQHQHHGGGNNSSSSNSNNHNATATTTPTNNNANNIINNNNNSSSNQHQKIHQDDSRWRDSSNASDLSSVSSFDHQGNISHSNHLSDLAMMSTLSYPRIQPGFPPPVPPGYPPQLGPPTSAPQWIHHGGPGQPYVIPQQMIQTGGLGPSNQAAAAAAALHYGHIPQLAQQMQGLQIAHPGAPVGGYLPPQHQWSALWTHPIPQQPQPSMRLPASMQPPPSSQQQQQQSPQSTPLQQQPPPNPQQQQPPSATDNKLPISMPM